MEIKKVEKIVVEYPATNEVSKDEIKMKLPKKFLKFALVLGVIQSFPNKAHAVFPKVDSALAGDVAVVDPTIIQTAGVMEYIHPMYTISTNVGIVALGLLALSTISIGITKIVNKIKKIEKSVPKAFKILAIASGIIAVLSAIGILVFGN